METMNQKFTLLSSFLLITGFVNAQNQTNNYISGNSLSLVLLVALVFVPALLAVVFSVFNFGKTVEQQKLLKKHEGDFDQRNYFENLSGAQIETFLKFKNKFTDAAKSTSSSLTGNKLMTLLLLLLMMCVSNFASAQTANDASKPLLTQPGIIITIVLLLVPVLLGIVFIVNKANYALMQYQNKNKVKEAEKFADYLKKIEDPNLIQDLEQRSKALNYTLTNTELSGDAPAVDEKGIIQNPSTKHEVHFTAVKKKSQKRPSLDSDITKLILWYLGCSAFWLVIGTGIGEYVGMKFISPDMDHVSWLSFGRLRPVHTNIVFWGWASIGMIGLGYYVVPTVSNTKIFSIKFGYIALVLTNLMVILGTACLMMGINNGGGEFREYVWPVMAFFAVALILTLVNFFMTVAKRTTKEIYISSWYMVSAIIFTIIVALTAYSPFWQDGISETIVQGYFMHSGVGMWFTLYTLGLLYYFIPQQLNKPIYAYSLGILAFWTQILFYTIIGTHHFVFSSVPWWLQTVGIVGSMGMIIPVLAATINYVMTFKGQWSKVTTSYSIPFFLVAVVYYAVVSLQGTAEAFRFTNLLWHFTDFTVGHAHLGFYGIITFTIWGGAYAIVPRLTGKEPPQHLVGVHFWLAFIGLLFYAVPLMIGGTLRGVMWMEGKPFIDSVVMMFDYWVWRAIGGSLMFLSHVLYFYNFYKMTFSSVEDVDIRDEAFNQLNQAVPAFSLNIKKTIQ